MLSFFKYSNNVYAADEENNLSVLTFLISNKIRSFQCIIKFPCKK